MLPILGALLPVFLIIALGWVIKRIGFPDNAMWPPLERLVYFILFPCLITRTLATADLAGIDVVPMAAALLSAIFVMVGIVSTLRSKLHLSGPEYSSLFQGAVRWNGFVGLAAASSLFGTAGIALMSIAIAFMVPTVNLLSIYVLTRHAGNGSVNLRKAIITVASNPLIVACAIGITLNIGGLGLTPVMDTTLDMLGGPALALGLLAVGAALDVSYVRQLSGTIALGTGLKMLGMPLLVVITSWVFNLEGITRDIAILCASVPGATSSYILARQLGGDAPMMAGLITATTLAALVTMPLVLTLL